jgi:hypothetical protein
LEQQGSKLRHELAGALEALAIMQEELQKVHEMRSRPGK